MQEIFYSGNIDELIKDEDKEAFCVTTNSMIKRNGELVMGKGIAKYVNDTYPSIAGILAEHIREYGNTPMMIKLRSKKDGASRFIISLPTKKDWRDNSDIKLIQESCKEIIRIADTAHLNIVYLTRPGCGCGGLNWEKDVKPVIEKILDDRFVVVTGYNG